MGEILGRRKEQEILTKILASKNGELVAVYGRRRVGKTFLIREFFRGKGRYFELAGKKKASMREQLKNFAEALSHAFYDGVPLLAPLSWRDAFSLLTNEVKKISSQTCILFFDELPWLASRKSGFIQALDYFWNTYWSSMKKLKIILCGSAASWMLERCVA